MFNDCSINYSYPLQKNLWIMTLNQWYKNILYKNIKMNKNICTACLFLYTVVPITQQAQQTNIHMHRALAWKWEFLNLHYLVLAGLLIDGIFSVTLFYFKKNQGLEGMTPYQNPHARKNLLFLLSNVIVYITNTVITFTFSLLRNY